MTKVSEVVVNNDVEVRVYTFGNWDDEVRFGNLNL